MKKTISINIKGLNFIIEDDAYQLLQDYLDNLKNALNNQDGSDEILEDIELRIAELFSIKLNDNKTVVELTDVQEALDLLGKPEDYIEQGEDKESTEKIEQEAYSEKADKRLYRDTANASVGGVCGGLANYLNIDRVIIRAIFVLMVLFAGFGVSLYIILWIIIPKATSSIDRLKMKGKPITVESVKEEVRSASENIAKNSKNVSKAIFREELYQGKMNRVARIIGGLAGGFLVLIGIGFLIPFLIFIVGGFEFFPIDGDNGFLNFSQLGSLILNNDGDYFLLQLGIILGGFSVILFFLLLGGQLIVRLKSKWIKPTLVGLFLMGLAGLIITITIGVRTSREIAIYSTLDTKVGEISSQKLTILPYSQINPNKQTYQRSSNGTLLSIEDGQITFSGIDIKYVRSSDSLFRVRQIKSAHGISGKTADARCENIQQQIQIINDTVYISPNYNFPVKDKIRNQQIEMIIEVPQGAIIQQPNKEIQLELNDENTDQDEYIIYKKSYLKANGEFRNERTKLGYR